MNTTQKFSSQDRSSTGTSSGRRDNSAQTEQGQERAAAYYNNHHDYDDGLVHGHSWAPATHAR